METARLRLEPLDLAHLEDFHRIWSDPDTTKWSSRGVSTSITETQNRITGILPDPSRPGINNYSAFIRSPQNPSETHVIGIVGVHKDDPVPELGYIFHPSAWGKGYATEAVDAFVRHYFMLRPEEAFIEAKVDSKNGPSIRVLEKCGFDEVETLVGGAVSAWMEPSVRDLVVFRAMRK